MKTISRTRKCVGYLALAIVLLIAADRYYPAAMCALGIGAVEPSERNAGADIVAAARSQIGVTVKYAPAYEAIEYPNGDVSRARGVCTDGGLRGSDPNGGVRVVGLREIMV